MRTKNNKELIKRKTTKYPEHITLENLSFRDLEHKLKSLFTNAPDHTTLWYRFCFVQ